MVKIITDSAADFEPYELQKSDILCVPMQIRFDEESYIENTNLTKSQFYKLLKTSKNFPKTSQPSPGDFETVLQNFKDNNDECVIITISSSLSGTYQNASLVKKMLDYDNCYIIDSLSATGGERLLTEQAVTMRDAGKSAKEIYEELEILKRKIRLYACVDTLEYLHKGGRLSKTAYTVGTIANIKPVICISREGRVEVVSKAFSTKKGIKSVCQKMEQFVPDVNYPVYILYSDNSENAILLTNYVKESGFDVSDNNIVNIGATIGSHVGANACGIVYVSKE